MNALNALFLLLGAYAVAATYPITSPKIEPISETCVNFGKDPVMTVCCPSPQKPQQKKDVWICQGQ